MFKGHVGEVHVWEVVIEWPKNISKGALLRLVRDTVTLNNVFGRQASLGIKRAEIENIEKI